MKKKRIRWLLAGMGLSVLCAGWSGCSGPSEMMDTSGEAVMLSIESSEASSGQTTTIPVSISDAGGLRELEVEIEFDPAIATALGADIMGSIPGADLEVEVGRGEVELELELDTPAPAGVGLMVEILFQINPDADPGACTALEVDLEVSFALVGPPPGTPVTLTVQAGQLCAE